MIKALNRGGVPALLIGLVVVAMTKYVPMGNAILHGELNWLSFVLFMVLFVVQAIWFQRVIHRARFFEQSTPVPLILFLIVGVSLPSQVNAFTSLAVNFVWLTFYHKLFYPQDRDQVDRQIFLEAGLLAGILILLDPTLLLALPFILVLLNQFVASSFNRTLVVFTTTLLLLVSFLSIVYFTYDMEAVTAFVDRIQFSIDLGSLLTPGSSYIYLIYVAATILIALPVYRRLAFMQNKKRYIINMLYLQVLFGILVAVLSGSAFTQALNYTALPIAFILSFGVQHIQIRWFQNVVILVFLFALVFTQVVYMLP